MANPSDTEKADAKQAKSSDRADILTRQEHRRNLMTDNSTEETTTTVQDTTLDTAVDTATQEPLILPELEANPLANYQDPLVAIEDEEVREAIRAIKDAVIVSVTKAISDRYSFLIQNVAKGKIKNNNRTKGYLEALQDTHRDLLNWIDAKVETPKVKKSTKASRAKAKAEAAAAADTAVTDTAN
jgi:hypothetical protein